MEGIESAIQNQIFSNASASTNVDKLLGRDDGDRVNQLLRKEILTREDLNELLHHMSSPEIKLININAEQQFVLAKLQLYASRLINHLSDLEYYEQHMKLVAIRNETEITNVTLLQLEQIKKQIASYAKVIIHQFFFLSRSTVSIRGLGLDTLSTTSYRVHENKFQQQEQIFNDGARK